MKSLRLLAILIVLLRKCRSEYSCNPLMDCLNVEKSGDFVPDPDDCEKYYVCVSQPPDNHLGPTQDSVKCPDGTYFDQDTSNCMTEYVTCRNRCPPAIYRCQAQCPSTFKTLTSVASKVDCSVFTICQNKTESLLRCPDDSPYFNGATCVADATQCCNFCTPYCTPKNIQIQDPCSCTSYYTCNKEGPVSEDTSSDSCDLGQYFNEMEETCVNGACNNTCPYCGVTDTTVAITPTTIDSTYWSESEATTQYLCTAYCEYIGIQVQNPCDCTSFYICLEVGPVPDDATSYQCNPGQYFDETAGSCIDGTCNNTCPYCGVTDTTLAITPTIYTTDTTYWTESEATTQYICRANCKYAGVQVQNPCDCTSFYICLEVGPVPDDATSYQCNPGQYFDETVGSCIDGACNNTCPYCGVTDTTVAITPTTTDSADWTQSEATTQYLCTANCKYAGVQVQNPCDCTSFYICLEVGPVPDDETSYQCNPGQYFDETAGSCIDGTCNNTCPYCGVTDTTVVKTPTTTDSTFWTQSEATTQYLCTANCKYVGVQVQNPCDCTSFYICLEIGPVPDDATSYQCNPGQYFDETVGSCIDGACNNTCPYCGVTDTTVAITPTTTDSADWTQSEATTQYLCTANCKYAGVQVQNPCDCTSFYICLEVGPVPDDETSYQCNPGQYFDETAGSCIDGACNNTCPYCEVTDTTVAITPITADSTYWTQSEATTQYLCTANCKYAGVQVQNPCDCTSFYICLEVGPVPDDATSYQCNPGQYFDETAGSCIDGACNNTCPFCGLVESTLTVHVT